MSSSSITDSKMLSKVAKDFYTFEEAAHRIALINVQGKEERAQCEKDIYRELCIDAVRGVLQAEETTILKKVNKDAVEKLKKKGTFGSFVTGRDGNEYEELLSLQADTSALQQWSISKGFSFYQEGYKETVTDSTITDLKKEISKLKREIRKKNRLIRSQALFAQDLLRGKKMTGANNLIKKINNCITHGGYSNYLHTYYEASSKTGHELKKIVNFKSSKK